MVEVGGLERTGAYVDALLGELERERARLGRLETVYLGGGTPTLVGAELLARLLGAVRPHLAAGAEVTVEANPETVDEALLGALVEAGATRISIGAQSLRPHVLRALDRRAGPEAVRSAVRRARAAGFRSVSMDLLFAVPGQAAGDLAADLAEVLELRPDHVSWYELELKPGSALAARGTEPVDEDLAADAYRGLVSALEGAGYEWYETANFALQGHRCRHSLAYWGAADYVGIGVGAVGTVDGLRWRNAPGVDAYLAAARAGRPPRRSLERLDPDTRRRERWMLALRTAGPVDAAWAGRLDRPDRLGALEEIGLVRRVAGGIELTREGRFVQNAVLGELMEYAS